MSPRRRAPDHLVGLLGAGVLVLAVLAAPLPAGAQDPGISPRVAELRRQIEQNAADLDAAEEGLVVAGEVVQGAQRDLVAVRDRLSDGQAQLGHLYTAQVRAGARQVVVRRRALAAAQALARVEATLERRQVELSRQERVRDVVVGGWYRAGPARAASAGVLRAVTDARSAHEFLVAVDLLRAAARRRQEAVEGAAALRDLTQRTQAQATVLRAARDRRAAQVDVAREAAARVSRQQDLVVLRLRGDRHRQTGLVQQVEVQRRRQDAVVRELAATSEALAVELAAHRFIAGAPGRGGLIWPVDGEASSGFGSRMHPILRTVRQHTGVDIGAPAGRTIVSAGVGLVVIAGAKGGYGITVAVDHGGGVTTLYAHLSRALVRSGQVVAQGDPIGLVGSTGLSTGPHLHFEIRQDGTPRDPLDWF